MITAPEMADYLKKLDDAYAAYWRAHVHSQPRAVTDPLNHRIMAIEAEILDRCE